MLRRCLSLWPLGLFLLLTAIAAQAALHYWPDVLLQSVMWQKAAHQKMSALLTAVDAQPHQAGLSLLVFSLIYGVLHALGPGHGKVVITTYLATHPSRLKDSLKLTAAASLLQGVMAVVLVTLTLMVLRLSSRALHNGGFWMEKSSFVLVAALGVWLSVRALRRLYRLYCRRTAPPTIRRMVPLPDGARVPAPAAHTAGGDCGCGHRHLPTQAELARAAGWRTRCAIVCAMGLRPCSGAILVLLFAKVVGVFAWGIASALAMALGTAFTLSLVAVLVFYCRRQVERWSAARAPTLWQHTAWATLSLAGGLILLGTGMVLYLSAQPALSGGLRAFS